MKKTSLVAVIAAAALVLAGCAPAGDAADEAISVVASTNIYGAIAEQIGGDRIEVTSIIDSAAQDPHSYEATARDRLAVQKAALVIANGGGYDGFIDTLADGADARVLTAVEFTHEGEAHSAAEDGDGHAHIEGFNEHVWFDPHTMIDVVQAIATELGTLDAAGSAQFETAAAAIVADLEAAEADLEELKADAEGTRVFITEPLPAYLAEAAGLADVAPDGFAEAVEAGSGVAPAIMLTALRVIESGDVRAVLTNAQTGGTETARIEQAAKDAGIAVIAFTELLDGEKSYSEWLRGGVDRLIGAVRP